MSGQLAERGVIRQPVVDRKIVVENIDKQQEITIVSPSLGTTITARLQSERFAEPHFQIAQQAKEIQPQKPTSRVAEFVFATGKAPTEQPVNIFKHGLPGSSEHQEWKEKQRKDIERARQSGGSGRGGGDDDRPVAGGEGDENREYWSEQYHAALAKRGKLIQEAMELSAKGRKDAAEKKWIAANRETEHVQHFREEFMRSSGASEKEIERSQQMLSQAADAVAGEVVEEIQYLKEKRDQGGLNRKELQKWNKLKEAFGDMLDDL